MANRVLIAYDGSPSAATALRVAAGLFRDARATVATVPPDPVVRVARDTSLLAMSPAGVEEMIAALGAEARRQADETAQEAVEQARALGLDAEAATIEPTGPPWYALLESAHRLGADVIVCGTRGRGAFARALLGSTASTLLHQTDVPLLIVPDGGGSLDGPVVIAYDGSDGARKAIETAGRLFAGRAAVVVHAWEPLFHRGLVAPAVAAGRIGEGFELVADLHSALADKAAATTQEGVDAARAAGLDASGDVVEAGDGIWRAVATAARAHGASVLAMGTRGLGAARSVFLGSVSSSLVHNAELPVLVVPQESSQ
ncbi:MAG TPA: universal stress protein [Solirubrobacter sp.]|nr:universal stress protein [Solirubrobacter sp.]